MRLMIVEPERYLAGFAKAGADHLVVQAESSATIHPHRVPSQIHELGNKAGMVLDPASPTELIEYVLHLCDVVVVMAHRARSLVLAAADSTINQTIQLRSAALGQASDARDGWKRP